jgi:hypothetical protein
MANPAIRLLAPLTIPIVFAGVAAAQFTDPRSLSEVPRIQLALASVALVLVFGGVAIYRYGNRVDRSVDSLIDRPGIAVAYGLIAYILVLFSALFLFSQIGRLGVANSFLTPIWSLGLAAAIGAVTGYGFVVVGTLLTDIQGQRRPQHGLVLGALLSGVGWVALPFMGGVAVWTVVAAFGIGGSMRKWIHSEHTVEAKVGR